MLYERIKISYNIIVAALGSPPHQKMMIMLSTIVGIVVFIALVANWIVYVRDRDWDNNVYRDEEPRL